VPIKTKGINNQLMQENLTRLGYTSAFGQMKQQSLQQNQYEELEMWANAQRDGRPAEYRWCPLFNAEVWLTPTTTLCLKKVPTF